MMDKMTYEELEQRVQELEHADSELKKVREREAHINRVLQAIRDVNQLIVKGAAPEPLMKGVCENLTETRGYFNAWMALVDEAGTSVTMTASSGFDGGFASMESRLLRGEFPSCMRKTLGADRLVVTRNPPEDCRDCPLSSAYAGRASLSRRLRHAGKCYGILSVSVPKAYAYDVEEQQLFTEMTDDLGFALHKMETEEQNRLLNRIVLSIPQPMSFLSSEYRYLAVNDVYAELYSTSPEKIIGHTPADFLGQHIFETEIKPHLDQALNGREVRYEVESNFPGKGMRWMAMSYIPCKDEGGNVKGVISHGYDITENKKLEISVKEKTQLLQDISDHMFDLVSLTDLEGNFEFVGASHKILNYDLDSLIGRNVLDFVHPEHLPEIASAFRDFTSKLDDNRAVEYRYRCADGRYLWFETVGRFIRDAGGHPRQILFNTRDVTQRKKHEEMLRDREAALCESRDLLDATQRLAKVGGWVWDVPSRTMTWTDQTYRIHGFEPGEVAAGSPEHVERSLACYDPDDRPVIEAAFLRCAEEGVSYDLEFPFTTVDGRRRWIQTTAQPVMDGQRVVKVIGNIVDITERKQAEETLRQSERRFQRMLGVVPDMISIHSPEMDILYSNWQGFAAVPKEKQIPNTKCYQTYRGFDTICPDCQAGSVLESRKPIQKEVLLPDGTWVDLRAIPVLDQDNNVEMFMEWVRDITERKTAEKEREKLQHQLSQSQKMEGIGSLAGGVAHDLNNLLSPILGYSEMLRDDLDPEDNRRQSVDEIMSAGLRARDLVRQLLAFSRKQILEFKPVDLNRVVAGLKNLLQRTIREDIDMVFDLSSDMEVILADIGQIEQVIMNLAVNAADAMPGGGQLTMETSNVYLDEEYTRSHQSAEPGRHVMLAISDSGHGMDEATREHIFEPFFSTKGEQGTGLGLSTVYGIVKQHGGNIWVYSEPGRGTTFKIYLPVAGKSEAEEEPRPEGTQDLKGSETILLVEDNDQVRRLAKSVLSRNGYRVLDAKDGGEALDILGGHDGPVHLLLSDVVLPGMNGKELYEEALAMRPSLKVLYMSGYTGNVIAHRGVLDEGVQFIQKPFTVHGLAAKVRELLGEE